ncbi:lipopolysaccharide biosynthesis glycosyltransferase, partial [Lactobacillus delbrueckii subsp. bulgaricus]|nr:lipopolysaccharide biosynthesis glycosyltransferase [Lactobacillus delbrueckii subsp. bulgaricus]
DHDLVTSYVANFKQNAHDEIMIHCCTEEIFGKLRASVAKCSPEYLSDFDKFFNQNKAVLFNMMFCRGDLFDEYC